MPSTISKHILAQWARQAPWNDCAALPTLVGQAHEHTPIGCVLATPSSIPNATTPFAASNSRHKVSSRPNAAPVAVHPACASRCGRTSPLNNMENAP